MKKPRNLSVDVSIANTNEDGDEFSTTYRAEGEGLSIGRNFLRFHGAKISSSLSIDDFIISKNTLGQGTSGVVRRARLKRDSHLRSNEISDMIYALKEFPLSNESNQDQYIVADQSSARVKKRSSMLVQELKMLCRLQCECLVELVGAFYDPGKNVTMVLEYMDLGSLQDFLKIRNTTGGNNMNESIILSEKALSSVAFQMLRGLAYLHFEGIIHRDIKPENVLCNSLGKVKLSDLGISSSKNRIDLECSGLHHTVVGTTTYFSPERLIDKAYGFPSDIWSFGLVIIECATGGWNPFFTEIEILDNGDEVVNKKKIRSIVEVAMILDNFCIDDILKRMEHCTTSAVDWKKELCLKDGLCEVLKWSLQRLPGKFEVEMRTYILSYTSIKKLIAFDCAVHPLSIFQYNRKTNSGRNSN